MRRTYKVRRNDEGEAQRRRWTFYEAKKVGKLNRDSHKSTFPGGQMEKETGYIAFLKKREAQKLILREAVWKEAQRLSTLLKDKGLLRFLAFGAA